MQQYEPTIALPSLSENGKSVLARGRRTEKEDRETWLKPWWDVTAVMIEYARVRISEAEEAVRAYEKRIADLESLVMRDNLTGLLNRRGFLEVFAREVDRVSRGHGHGGLLILIDLDNFHVITHTHGHMAGDAALRLVARTLKDNSRAMDACARMGGDEFVLLLAATERDKALVRAQNLIKRLNALSFVWHRKEIPIRTSLGLKDYGPDDTPETFFDERTPSANSE